MASQIEKFNARFQKSEAYKKQQANVNRKAN